MSLLCFDLGCDLLTNGSIDLQNSSCQNRSCLSWFLHKSESLWYLYVQAAPFISMMSDRRSSRMSINDKPVNAENTKMSRAKDRDSLLKRWAISLPSSSSVRYWRGLLFLQRARFRHRPHTLQRSWGQPYHQWWIPQGLWRTQRSRIGMTRLDSTNWTVLFGEFSRKMYLRSVKSYVRGRWT